MGLSDSMYAVIPQYVIRSSRNRKLHIYSGKENWILRIELWELWDEYGNHQLDCNELRNGMDIKTILPTEDFVLHIGVFQHSTAIEFSWCHFSEVKNIWPFLHFA